jgi:23S rRNA (adenine-N6)-dimethyltransferase
VHTNRVPRWGQKRVPAPFRTVAAGLPTCDTVLVESRTEHRRSGRRRARYAQNLFRDSVPVRRLVDRADLGAGDVVYDLGAGTGMITRELVRRNARVIAVEMDSNLARRLRERFRSQAVTILEQDLEQVEYESPFKVVANIPFNLTAVTLKRLLVSGPYPQEALLVLQREAAGKYAGVPRENEVSLKAKPWFDLSIVQTFRPTDFVPAPAVEVVLLRILRRREPLLPETQRFAWHSFVSYAFGRSKQTLKLAFKHVFSNLQWKRLARDLGFESDATLTNLDLKQWLGLFRFFQEGISADRQRIVMRTVPQPPTSTGSLVADGHVA